MTASTDLYDARNIERAWRWMKSNPDAHYKAFFRTLYGIYEVAEEPLLASLRDRIRRGSYVPTNSCKIFFPKPSGILRPYTLLTVEDQIAFQAAANVVADRLQRRVKSRYHTEVFGHLYAGRSSMWFYRKWSKGYAKFNEAARKAFTDGFRFTASFDLTACYDSLDHGVLRYFLARIGCDEEFCRRLTDWLSVWTATDHNIYHNHGIPQGPLSSGLLSEVVLQHFDANRGQTKTVRYMRYVDDIRLFAKTEKELRLMLIRLDKLSKDIGLFPQSAKIGIHRVTDIEEELKSVSRPTESSIERKSVDQVKLRTRLNELTPRLKVQDPTRFKYLLAHADPNATVLSRLWRIYDSAPEYYSSIARYLERYDTFPAKAGQKIIQVIDKQDLYPAIAAEFVRVCRGRLREQEAAVADRLFKRRWQPKNLQADLLAHLGCWLIERGQLTYRQTEYACLRTHSWWARSQMIAVLSDEFIGEPSLASILNRAIRDSSNEVALTAALYLAKSDIEIASPRADVNTVATAVLKEFGKIQRGRRGPCGIEQSLWLMSRAKANVNWKSFFGSNYLHAERQIVECRGLATTNATAWVNGMDVLLDLLLASLYRNDPSLGIYNIGGIGSVMTSLRLKTQYPNVQALVESIHSKRYVSHLSHAMEKRTGRPTKAIRFGYLKKAHRLVRAAVYEIGSKF